MSETKPGMSSWTEKDIRRIMRKFICENAVEFFNHEEQTYIVGLDPTVCYTPQDTESDQAASEYTQEGWVDESFQDSVTAD